MKGNREIVQFQGIKFQKLYDNHQLIQCISKMAKQINTNLSTIRQNNENAKILLVGVLNGCFMFFSDLCKMIQPHNIAVEFIKCKSYRGMVRQQLSVMSEFDWQLANNAYVLIIDDICDSGNTLYKLIQLFYEKGANKVEAAVLINRPDKQQVVAPNYYGLVCSEFIIGFGLDLNSYARNLPHIYQKIQSQ